MADEPEQKVHEGILASLPQNEEQIIIYMAYLMMIAATVVYIVTTYGFSVPYGRYASTKFGMLINAKFAWFVQEIPAFAVPVWCVFFTDAFQLSKRANVILVGMMIVHYFQR